MDDSSKVINNTNFSRIAWVFLSCVFLIWSFLLSAKFAYFGFYDWDLAIYDQILWNLCHGSAHSSLLGVPFLADHAHYIAFLIAPIYFLFPHPLTLVNLELLSFLGGAFVLFKICEKKLGPSMALVLLILYVMHPANIFMLFYEFHFESLALVFIFLLFYCMQEQKYITFLITALVLMLIKENMAMIVFMFGVYGMLFKKGRRLQWGVIPCVLSGIFFVFTMFILIPYIRKAMPTSNSVYWSLYSALGNSPQSIAQTIFFHPVKLMEILWTPQNLSYVHDLFVPYFFTSFFSPHILLLAFPIFLQNMLSGSWTQHTIYFHYAATIVPFIALASLSSLVWIKTRFSPMIFRAIFILVVINAAFNLTFYWPRFVAKVNSWVDPQDLTRAKMIEKIPPGAGVVASFEFLSHLTHRKGLYAFYNVWRDTNYFTGQTPFRLPDTVQYALINFKDPWLQADLKHNYTFTHTRVQNFLKSSPWKIKASSNGIVLYER